MFNDGANLIKVPIDGQLIDMVLSGSNAENLTAGELKDIPIVTRSGLVLRLHQLAQIDVVNAPEQVRRLGGRQSISLQLRPNNTLALEEVVTIIDNEILPDIRVEALQQGGVSTAPKKTPASPHRQPHGHRHRSVSAVRAVSPVRVHTRIAASATPARSARLFLNHVP